MNKIKINLDLLLPDVPDEKDTCVHRISSELKDIAGIEETHIVKAYGDAKAQLCFHYDPSVISVEKLQRLAEQAGARITRRYKHIIVQVSGIRHQRQTKLIEAVLQNQKGILSISASAAGTISIEYDTQVIAADNVYTLLEKQGLAVLQVQGDQSGKIVRLAIPRNKRRKQTQYASEEAENGNEHGGLLGKNTELIFSLTCGLLIAFGFGLSLIATARPAGSTILYVIAYFFGGFFTAKEAFQTISKGGFEIDFLMLVAAIGAGMLGKWQEGALLLFLFSLGHALEHYAMERARKSIAALMELAPKNALLKTNGQTKEVEIEVLKAGDVVIVKPNTKIPADGLVTSGNGSVNQAPITGESIPIDKSPVDNPSLDVKDAEKLDSKHRVFAGTINGNEVLEIKVTKETTDSTLSRLVKMVNEAQTQKSPTQQFTDKLERIFVPAVLVLVTLLCFAFLLIDEPFSKSFYRAMSVLVAASPCALAIATPSAVLSGVARAARAGVLIKGGRPLEDLGTLTAIAFDKTGTLTEGKPKLTRIIPFGNITEVQLLKIVVAIEELSDHPIAKAIVRDGRKKLGNEEILQAQSMVALHGKGIKATLGKGQVYAGNLTLFETLDNNKPTGEIIQAIKKLEEEGNTTMLIRKNEKYIGIVAVMDTPREEAKQTLIQLKQVGIRKMIMLTGDNQKVAAAIAGAIGITDLMGSLLPEQKVEAIQKLARQEGKVAMIGDGVNDAPAMAKSTVGIAMGAAGSDVALETADIALMGDKLLLLPFAIGLSRKSKQIIRQNLVISLSVVAVLIPLTILDIASIGPAIAAHEGSTLVVVINALRLLAYKGDRPA